MENISYLRRRKNNPNGLFTVKQLLDVAFIPQENISLEVKSSYEKKVSLVARANAMISKDSICFQLYHDSPELVRKVCTEGRALFCVAKEAVDGVPTLISEKPETLYADMCNAYIRNAGVNVTAITGSIGKTTTKKMLEKVYQKDGKTFCAAANTNLLNGAGYLAQHLPKGSKYFIQECSEDTKGYMASFSRCLTPHVAIITTIDKSHLELFDNEDDIKRECFSLADYVESDGFVITNMDDNDLSFYRGKARLLTVSLDNSDADFWVSDIQRTIEGLNFSVHDPSGRVSRVNLFSVYALHSIYCALYAFACGFVNGIEYEKIIAGLADFRTEGTRNNIFKAGDVYVYADCYNANGKSVKAAIETMDKFPIQGKRIAVLGDIAEVGETAGDIHRQIIQDVFCSKIESLFVYGQELEKALAASGKPRDNLSIVRCKSHSDIVAKVRKTMKRGDMILFKASHASNLEKCVKGLFPLAYYKTSGKEHLLTMLWQAKIRFN